MSAIWARIENEPVLVTTLIGAVLELLIAFGITIDDGQKAAVMAVVAALLAFIARSQVTPVGSVLDSTGAVASPGPDA